MRRPVVERLVDSSNEKEASTDSLHVRQIGSSDRRGYWLANLVKRPRVERMRLKRSLMKTVARFSKPPGSSDDGL